MRGKNIQKSDYRHFKRPSFYNSSIEPNFLRRPPENLIAGDIRLGFIDNAELIFGLRKEELTQHTLIVGRSGTGKTSLMRIMQLELYKNGIPFLSFDLTKYGTRYLKKYIPELLIIRRHEFFFNAIAAPPKVPQIEWMLTLCEVTSEIFDFRPAAKAILIHGLQSLFKENKNPTFVDFHARLEEIRQDKKAITSTDSINRIMNKTRAICLTMGKQLDVIEGIPIQELLKRPVCIELIGISVIEIQLWIVSLIMAWIASYRAANSHLGKLKHVLFFDEASQLFK